MPLPGRVRSSSSVSSLSSALPPVSQRAPGSAAVATERSGPTSPAVTIGARPTATPARVRLEAENLSAYFGIAKAVSKVSIGFRDREVTAIIGPSGCGKSTLLRCLNRMHETVPTARVEGTVSLDEQSVYARGVNPIEVRRHVGHGVPASDAFSHYVDSRQRRSRACRSSAGRSQSQPRRRRLSRTPSGGRRYGTKSRIGCARAPWHCLEDSNSVFALPAHSRLGRRYCCSTSRPRRLIR